MAKLTIKQLECKTQYYLKWFFVTSISNHGRNCAIGTILYKDHKSSVVLAPRDLVLVDDHPEYNFRFPLDFVSLDIHKVTPSEYKLEYQNMVNFLLSCNPKQLKYVTTRWSDSTHYSIDIVDEFIDDIIWPYLNR